MKLKWIGMNYLDKMLLNYEKLKIIIPTHKKKKK